MASRRRQHRSRARPARTCLDVRVPGRRATAGRGLSRTRSPCYRSAARARATHASPRRRILVRHRGLVSLGVRARARSTGIVRIGGRARDDPHPRPAARQRRARHLLPAGRRGARAPRAAAPDRRRGARGREPRRRSPTALASRRRRARAPARRVPSPRRARARPLPGGRLSRAVVQPRSLDGVGARRAARPGVRLRLEHLPGAGAAVRRPRRAGRHLPSRPATTSHGTIRMAR